MDYRVFAYLVAMSIGTGLLFGLAPARQLSRLDVNATMKHGGRVARGGRRGDQRIHSPGDWRNGAGRRAARGSGGDDPYVSEHVHGGPRRAHRRHPHRVCETAAEPVSRSQEQVTFFDRLTTRLTAIRGCGIRRAREHAPGSVRAACCLRARRAHRPPMSHPSYGGGADHQPGLFRHCGRSRARRTGVQ